MKRKFMNPQQDNASRKERRNKARVTVQANLVVNFWELMPMESGYNNSEEQYTATVNKGNDKP